MPTASIPGTRGNVTPCASPSRMCSSERLRPNALTLISTHPGAGSGTGTSRITRASGGPGRSRTTARIMPLISAVPSSWSPAHRMTTADGRQRRLGAVFDLDRNAGSPQPGQRGRELPQGPLRHRRSEQLLQLFVEGNVSLLKHPPALGG